LDDGGFLRGELEILDVLVLPVIHRGKIPERVARVIAVAFVGESGNPLGFGGWPLWKDMLDGRAGNVRGRVGSPLHGFQPPDQREPVLIVEEGARERFAHASLRWGVKGKGAVEGIAASENLLDGVPENRGPINIRIAGKGDGHASAMQGIEFARD